MNDKMLQLDYLINLEKFQIIQDDMSKATDMAIITVDYMGKPVTQHSHCSAFCQQVRKDPILGKYCEKCDSRGGLEAVRSQEEYIYLCHVGLVDIALPIIVNGQYLGALMAGQVLLENPDNEALLEHIVSKKYQINLLQYPELKALYDQLPVMSLDKIKAVTHMMQHLMNYIIGEAVLKISLNDTNEKLAAYMKEEHDLEDEDNTDLQDIQHYYPHTGETPSSPSSSKSILLQPAIDYIHNNSHKKINMEKMAYICNISTSYFSKIFKRETGDSFSNYVNKVKTAKAIELLESTSDPIVNISLDLGYDDCGYFIKVFKKNYGITPASYRKNYRNNG